MHTVEIIPVLNGWVVKVGCQTVAFNQVETLLTELRSYLVDPDATVKRYQSESINSRFMGQPCLAPAPQAMNECSEVRRGPAPQGLGVR